MYKPLPVAYGMDKMSEKDITHQVAVLLFSLNLSLKAKTATSIKEIKDVIPASTIHKKNKTPKNCANGIWLIISGNTANISPGPEVATSAMETPVIVAINPKAPKTPKPASNST